MKQALQDLAKRAAARALRGTSTVLGQSIEHLADARRVANFLRGHLAFRPRPDDVYIATYPRSGTTWMQYTVHLFLHGTEEFEHLSDVSPWYERSLAVGSLEASDFERFSGPRVFKTHLPYEWVPRVGKKIYIVRDGRDVAVSYFHFYRSQLGFRGNFGEFLQRFLAGDLQYGSYFRHVAGWARHRDDPSVLWLRYERLSADQVGTLRLVGDFLGLDVDDVTIDRVRAATSFSRMKALEAKFDHATVVLRERGMRTSGFIRAGRVGDADSLFDDVQTQAFDRVARAEPRFGPQLRLAAFLH